MLATSTVLPSSTGDADGELNFDDHYDDFKIIGAYSSAEAAHDEINRARKLAGFQEEPDCFIIDTYTPDEDNWADGLVSISDDEDD